jgi:hypothetical protein
MFSEWRDGCVMINRKTNEVIHVKNVYSANTYRKNDGIIYHTNIISGSDFKIFSCEEDYLQWMMEQ